MILYETIFTRRQVRSFTDAAPDTQVLDDILTCVQEAEQISGQHARFELVSASEVSGDQGASHYLLSFCEANSAAYANVGYVLQKVDLYIQSQGLGSGWFMSAKPKKAAADFCIALAFGETEEPTRKSEAEFKRKPLEEICADKNSIARAVRLAPSSLNSQPLKLRMESERAVIEDAGKGFTRLILKNKLNKIDIGIAARHAVLALEQEGKTVTQVLAFEEGKKFEIQILFH